MLQKFYQPLLPFVFSPLSAAAHNVSRFRVVLGAEFFTAIPQQRCRQSFQRHRQHPRAAAAATAAATAVGVYIA